MIIADSGFRFSGGALVPEVFSCVSRTLLNNSELEGTFSQALHSFESQTHWYTNFLQQTTRHDIECDKLLSIYRYVEKNARCHQNYRRYNSSLPKYLINRPRNFVKHCMAKITAAEDIPASSIKSIDLDKGIFKVRSSSDTWYMVDFGHSNKISPSCECIDWLKFRLLCKHFFAVFEHYPSWNFEKILHSYTHRPYFTLDNEVVSLSTTLENNQTDHLDTNAFSVQDNAPSVVCQPVTSTLLEPPRPNTNDHNRSNAFARDCREVLTEAKQFDLPNPRRQRPQEVQQIASTTCF